MADDNDLLTFVSALKGGDGMRVEERLGDGYVRLRISEAERRQAKHDVRCVEDAVIELLRNARDAGAKRIFVGTTREGNLRTVLVIDDGVGIPPSLHARVFDARVTSKLDTMHMDKWGVHGRGMALFSIKENAISAQVLESDVGRGCAIRVVFDVSTLPERADQSTWPRVTHASGDYTVRGPHNIYRTCVEFGLEERGVCNVYVGSPSEALATMRARCAPAMPLGANEEQCGIPITASPSMAKDARELAARAQVVGIDISERNAHRILRGQVPPLVNVVARVGGRSANSQSTPQLDSADGRKLTLDARDEEVFQQALREAFRVLEERYFVRLACDPTVRMSAGRVTVSYEFIEDD
ncbi:MAG: ATP-binding protein [Atopobiaceae bacterium]|nr:ATP-binding protein [Atopobiaceae bacterium]